MIIAEKQRQRAFGKNARRSLTKEERERFSEAICLAIEKTEAFQQSERILIYAAFGAEVSLDPLARRHPEKKLFYPVCLEEFQMVAARPHDEKGWELGDYGIRTPILERSENVSPEEIDLVLVPCTAFDENCYRVGMGKGYYDRYLTKCVNAVKIGVAFECQKVETAAVDEYDVRLDGYVTEKKEYSL